MRHSKNSPSTSLSTPASAETRRIYFSFGELWKTFCAVQSGQWSKKTKENLQCLFKKHVIPIIGQQAPREVTLTSLQLLLNRMAETAIGNRLSVRFVPISELALSTPRTKMSFQRIRPEKLPCRRFRKSRASVF